MADALVRFGGNLHISLTEYSETAVQKHKSVEAVLTGRQNGHLR